MYLKIFVNPIGPDPNVNVEDGHWFWVWRVVCVQKFFENFFGGNFKYVIRKNSEFLAGNLNANGKCKIFEVLFG